MKRNIMSRVNILILNYKGLLYFSAVILFCLTFVNKGVTQSITKVFEKEISVSENIQIKTKGPQSVRITGSGAINTRQIADRYVVSGKNKTPYIYVINKKLDIHTWSKNSIKQVTKVVLECENPSDANELLQALDIRLKENAVGKVTINCELNISHFKVKNSWFGADANSIILNNGQEYNIKFLELSNTLYIPENSDLVIESKETDISIENHNGLLDVNMHRGHLSAKEIGSINGKFQTTNVVIDKIDKGLISLKHSDLKINEISSLELESTISTINILAVEKLIINSTINDKFNIDQVNKLDISESLFSSYDIKTANESLEMNLKNGDLHVANLGSNLSQVIINGHHSTLKLGIQKLDNYEVTCQQINQSKYQLPNSLKMTTSSNNQKIYTYGNEPQKTKMHLECVQCEVTLLELPK